MNTELREALVEGLNYMRRVPENLNLLTDAIKSSKDDLISQQYNHLKEGLEWIYDILRHFENFLELDYSNITVNKQGADKIIKEYEIFIKNTDELFNSKKYNDLQDIIEVELSKHFKKIITIFNKVKVIINEKEH